MGFYVPMASTGNLFAQANGRYELEAYHRGLDAVNGHATVPLVPVALSLDSIDAGEIPYRGWDMPFREFTLVMADSGQAGYYRIEAFERLRGTATIPMYTMSIGSDDILITNNPGDGGRVKESLLFSNASFLNSNRSIDVRVFNIYPNSGMEVIFKLTKLDSSAYFYDVTLNTYKRTGGPFTQPVTVYNNVENGLGVICAKSSVWVF